MWSRTCSFCDCLLPAYEDSDEHCPLCGNNTRSKPEGLKVDRNNQKTWLEHLITSFRITSVPLLVVVLVMFLLPACLSILQVLLTLLAML